MNELCHCGKPLHYTNKDIEAFMREQVKRSGQDIIVSLLDGRQYRVQRHYIALHGIHAQDLDKLGFYRMR